MIKEKQLLPNNVFAHLNFLSGSKKGSKIILKFIHTTIGNHNTDIVLNDTSLSACHAVIIFSDNQFLIKDNNSMTGIFVNGKPVASTLLIDGDEIKIGSSLSGFHYTIAPEKTTSINHELENRNPVDTQNEHYDSIRKRINEELSRIHDQTVPHKQKKRTSSASQGIEVFFEIQLSNPVSSKNSIYKITKGSTIIGTVNSDIILSDASISKQHALIEIFDQNHIFIRDLGSETGIFVNNKKTIYCQISHHDVITLGRCICRLIIEKKTIA